MHEIRQEKMNRFIQEREVVTIKELHASFPEVSLMTIHRDLDVLKAGGFITKVRGGARSIRCGDELVLEIRGKKNQDCNKQNVEKAAKEKNETPTI